MVLKGKFSWVTSSHLSQGHRLHYFVPKVNSFSWTLLKLLLGISLKRKLLRSINFCSVFTGHHRTPPPQQKASRWALQEKKHTKALPHSHPFETWIDFMLHSPQVRALPKSRSLLPWTASYFNNALSLNPSRKYIKNSYGKAQKDQVWWGKEN